VATPGRSQLINDLERFRKGGGAGYWDAASKRLLSLERLEIVQSRIARPDNPATLNDAIRETISDALDGLTAEFARGARALLGFTAETRTMASPTPREAAAARAMGLKYASAVRKPVKRYQVRNHPRSRIDHMLDQVAHSIHTREERHRKGRAGALDAAGSGGPCLLWT
jgi:hypothetical protein